MRYLSNSFSLNMLKGNGTLHFYEITLEELKETICKDTFKSIIGHKATADFLTKKLGMPVDYNREAIQLHKGDKIYVITLHKDGKPYRLEEGKILTEKELEEIEVKVMVVRLLG